MLRKALALLLVGVVALTPCLLGCHNNGAATMNVDPRLVARGTVETLETAWNVTAKACVAVAVAEGSEARLEQCKNTLEPAGQAIIKAAYAVDGWTQGGAAAFPCFVASAADAIRTIEAVVASTGNQLPTQVADALAMSANFAPQCVKTRDGGQ